ncbi:MAG: SGNH/GDSL hydrolase family protein [Ruminococcaceae bacterium]|nr:SGNH/GDSL hydrolase family protein [Oscillospiraceae bacterium]
MKVMLLGDSIRLSYSEGVRKALGADFEVHSPADNSRFSKYLLRQIFEEREALKDTRIVHFNCGLWDICNLFGDGTFTSEQEYIDTVLRIADILLARVDKVIFATTIPGRKENIYNSNSDIIRFNEIIVPLLREKGIIINDLYTPVASDVYRYISDDNLHLSDEGVEMCAIMVADKIRNAAAELE